MKSCPFCGSETAPRVADNVELRIHDDTEAYGFTVICIATPGIDGCGTMTGFWETEEEAINRWETRHDEKGKQS